MYLGNSCSTNQREFQRTGWWIIVFIVAEMSKEKGGEKLTGLLAFLEVRNSLCFVFFCLLVEMSLEISLVSEF